jgi:hypothetical protein
MCGNVGVSLMGTFNMHMKGTESDAVDWIDVA